jgi:hypothetical protein
MDYRQILEGVHQPAACANSIDRLMSMLERSRDVDNCLSMISFSKTSARDCTIGALRPSETLHLGQPSSTAPNDSSSARIAIACRGRYASWAFRGGSSNRLTVVWPLSTVNISLHVLG